jgi:hypothetical protein
MPSVLARFTCDSAKRMSTASIAERALEKGSSKRQPTISTLPDGSPCAAEG